MITYVPPLSLLAEKAAGKNIRRIGETARLFVDTGILIITAFISPFAPEILLETDNLSINESAHKVKSYLGKYEIIEFKEDN